MTHNKKMATAGLFLSLLLACAAHREACVREVPPVHEDPVVKEISGIASHINAFYTRVQYTPDSLRTFALCAQEYEIIEADLQSLVTRDTDAQRTLDQWRQYTNEHKERNTCKDDSLVLRRQTMENLFKAIVEGRNAQKGNSGPRELKKNYED